MSIDYRPLDDRQVVNRAILQELFPWVGSQTLDVLMASINSDLTPPFQIDATSTPSLTIDIGPSVVPNSVSGRNKSTSFLGTALPIFSGGTVTFPSTSGGNITTSTGGSFPLTLPSGDYVQVLLAIDESNDLNVTVGTPNAVLANALVPQPHAATQPFGYVTLQNIGGVIQNITQQNIYQFEGSGGGGGSGGGVAQEVALTIGTTSVTVTFPTPQSSANYVILGQLVNTIDPDPEFQPITITNKTTTGCTLTWNMPLDSSNYSLDYMIGPGVSGEMVGESLLNMGDTSATVTFPIAFSSSLYVVLAELVNTVDSLPMFQPISITAKTNGTFTATWNMPLETSNYRLAWSVAAYQ